VPHSLWPTDASGVLTLPSGRRVRGRRIGEAPGEPLPTFGVYLLDSPPPVYAWQCRWLQWPDFRLPNDRSTATMVLREAWERAETERVELACGAGRGRTGTALACLAVLDGVPATDAVAFVRDGYDSRAVETPWQRRYVERFLRAN
jgi:protein-tyrosine phosphatase